MSGRGDSRTGRRPKPSGLDQPVRVYPDLIVSATTSAVLLMCAYSLLCIFAPAELGVRADPLVPPAEPKPAWYLLFLYGLLRSGPPILGALAPVGLVALLLAVPYLDRSGPVTRRQRVLRVAFGVATAVAVVALTYVGWRM